MAKYLRIAAILLTAAVSLTLGAASVSASQTSDPAPYVILPEEEYSDGWISYQGKFYYIQDGVLAVGETEIDGIYYLFGYSGALKTDWQTVNGCRYYYDPATGEAVFGWVDYFGKQYYVSEDSGKLTGFQEIDSASYYFGTDGALCKGAFYESGTLYCSDPETGVLCAGIKFTDSGIYCTDSDGTAISGWQAEDNVRYYISPETMTAITGSFAEINGSCYYFDADGAMVTGMQTIEEQLYYFGADGVMLTQMWIVSGGFTYYFLADGSAAVGWLTLDGDIYYFQEDYTMAESVTLSIDGYRCTFDEAGVLISKVTDEIRLDVPDYKQFDEEWASESLGSSTIKSSGCLVTAMAMLHSYTTGSTVTPVTMRDMLTFSDGGALSKWSDIKNLGYSVVDAPSSAITEEILTLIHGLLLEGKPVVMGCKNSYGGQHYVTIIGYTGDGTVFTPELFLINDPGSSYNTVLSEFLAEFPNLYKIIY